MKKFNFKTAMMLSALALSACNSGGGGGNNATVTVPGVRQQSYPGNNGSICNVNANSYQCTSNGVAGPVVSFISLQDMCTKLQNDYSQIGYNERQFIINDQCRGQIGGVINQNLNGACPVGTILQNSMCVSTTTGQQVGSLATNTVDSKIMNCSINATAGEWSGIFETQVFVAKNIPTKLWTVMGKEKSYLGGIINTSRTIPSSRFADVTLTLSQSVAGQSDMLNLSIRTKDDKPKTVSVVGFAGSTTAASIVDDSADGLNISVECRSAVSVNLVKANNPSQYKCSGTESVDSRQSTLALQKPVSLDWQNDEQQLSNSLSIRTEGTVLNADGTLTLTQSSPGLTISTRSSLATTSTVNISNKDSNSKMNLSCKPL